MDTTKQVLKDAQEQLSRQAAVEKNQMNLMEYNFKQDCRRTAMQLASRNGSNDASVTVTEAQKLYDWLIDLPRPELI